MKIHWGWTKSLTLGIALATGGGQLMGQGLGGSGKPGSFNPAQRAASSSMPMMQPAMAPQGMPPMGMPPMGMPGMYPASYGGPSPMEMGEPQDMVMHGPPPMGEDCDDLYGGGCGCGGAGGACGCGGGLGGGIGGCGACGGAGCGACSTGPIRQFLSCGPFGGRFLCRNGDACWQGGIIPGLVGAILPYGEGGVCAQRWYDISVGGIALKRTEGGDAVNISSLGIAGPIVLTTDSVALDETEWGLNLSAAVQCGPGSNVEVNYFGLNSWQDSANVTLGQANLFSTFSDFGTNPNNGFDDPDRSFIHALTYRSELHNGEVNYRRRWVGPNCILQGSWLAGIRYFDLDEEMVFDARGQLNNAQNQGLRFLNASTETRNALTGFQVGGDLWWNVIPGLNVGGEAKGGIFGNVAETNSLVTANSIPAFADFASDATTAYVGDLSAQVVYRLNYSWTLKGGYHVLLIDNVALATNNFNTAPPAALFAGTDRVSFIDVNQNVAYDGYSISAEYLW